MSSRSRLRDPNHLPRVSKALIEELEKRFPNVLPTEDSITPQRLGFLQGVQRVVKLLRQHHEWQKEKHV